jgi:hypothetical protein
MHKVIVAQFVTLDGIVEDPDGSGGAPHGGWAFRYGPGPVSGDKFHMGTVLDTGVKLLGRTTWELFTRVFPGRDDEFSRRLNAMEKLVVSHSPVDVDRWTHSTRLDGDLIEVVTQRLRHQDVMVTDSSSIVDQLVAHDLVDEFRLMVFPTVIGTGRRLFEGVAAPLDLALVGSEDAGVGVLRQVYERKGNRCATQYVALREDERVRSGERLHPASTATTLRVGGLVTDGPFADTKEVFGGFYLVEAPDLDSALELAARIPAVRLGGSVEIRPLVE